MLEAEGLACGAVLGTVGVERHRVVFEGRAAHAGSTPMDRRADAGVAAARVVTGLKGVGVRHGGVCTAGRLDLSPGIVTAVPGRAELLVDQRHLDPGALAAMLSEASELWTSSAEAEGCAVSAERIWSIEPVPFHDGLIAAAREACYAAAGSDRQLPSGALHDASELARVVPRRWSSAPPRGGVSHAPGEDTPEADLALAVEAFGAARAAGDRRGRAGVKRVRVIAAGRVQGVFFRRSVADRAESRGVAGWVRNCPDGSVEAVFEGEPEAVDALVAFCREGPRGAYVDRVDVSDEQPEGRCSFEVR